MTKASFFDINSMWKNEKKPDFIINWAALTNVDFCEENRKKTYAVNVKIVQNI